MVDMWYAMMFYECGFLAVAGALDMFHCVRGEAGQRTGQRRAKQGEGRSLMTILQITTCMVSESSKTIGNEMKSQYYN